MEPSRPDFLMRLQRGFVTVAIVVTVIWFMKGREANLQQKWFLAAAACFAVAGFVTIALVRMRRKR